MIQALERSITQARRDALVFSVLTVVLTPFLLAAAALGLLFAIASSRHSEYDFVLARGLSFVGSLDALVGLIVFVSLCDQRGGRSPRPLEALGALGAAAGLVALSTAFAAEGAAFWSVYALVAMAALGLAGRAYVPRDDYYLGWCGGLLDDPFTWRDDWDRAHVGAGFAVMIPRFVVDAYATIFESLWLLGGVPSRELRAAVGIFQAIAVEDRDLLSERMAAAGAAGPSALRLLHRLELVQPGKERPHLTGRGRELVRGPRRG